MPINGSDLINHPWNTTFSPFTDLFEQVAGYGAIFWLIPISIIGVALYTKTREPVMISMYMIVSGALLATGNIFIGAIEMSLVFVIFAAIGFVSLFISLFFRR